MSQSIDPSGAERSKARSPSHLQRLFPDPTFDLTSAAENLRTHPTPAQSARFPIGTSSSAWTYPRQPPLGTSTVQPIPPQPSSSMFGNPMFYDPDQAVPQSTEANYQTWVANYQAHGQQLQEHGNGQFDYVGPTGNVPEISFPQQQQQQQLRQQMQQVPTQPALLHNQYNFVPDQYMPLETAAYDTHLVQHRPVDRPQRALPTRGARRGQHHSGVVDSGVQYDMRQHLTVDATSTYMQQQQSYSLPQGEAQPAGDQFIYPPELVSAESQPQQSYTFTHYNPHPEQLGAQAPQSAHTSSSDRSPFTPSSTELGGTDDGQFASGAGSQQMVTQLSVPTSPGNHPPSTAKGQPNKGKSKSKAQGQKRPRSDIQRPVESEAQSDDDDGNHMTIMQPMSGFDGQPHRLPGACKHCKKLKMKCEFLAGENTCRRCKGSGYQCVVEGRKPRNAPNKREYLLAQIRQKDVIIEKLLRELHSPYTATPMSIASYRLNTSPSDRTKQTVVDWLDRMQSSVESSNRLRTGETFRFESRAHAGGDSDEEAEGVLHNDATERGSVADPLGAADDSRDAAEQLPDAAVPIGLLAKMSLYNNTTKERKKEKTLAGDGESDDGDVGVASPDYFMPGPVHDLAMRANLIQDHSPPEILVYGLVTPDDVEGLFKIYYERLNVHVTLLDAEVHTPANTFARCPFLFTVICAVASRYYPPKSEIYPVAMHFAKRAAAEGLLNGWKSVELAQAYILLSIYAVPARRWEDDRSWLYTGLAIRIATDLNLHHASTIQPKSKEHAREIVNKTRLWINCYNLDRSMATQFGKPSTIKEDYTIRKSDDWYKRSPMNHPNDVGLCAYTQLLRIMASFHEEIYSDPSAPTGLNRALDFRAVTLRHDEQMTRYFDDWTRRFNEDPSVHDAAYKFRASLLPFLTSYSRLVMYSFGFQQAFHRGMQEGDNLFLDKCFQAAKTVILCMVESLCPSGFMRYSPDGHFIFASFASAFLLKLMRPEFARLITKEQEAEIFDLIGRLIKILSSPDVAIDERHTPKLHARFLAGLLARHRRDVATSGRIHPQHPPQAQMPHGGSPAGTGVYPSQSPSSSSSSPSQQVFPSPSSQHSFVDAHGVTGTHSASENMMSMEPIYQEEHAYAAGTSPLETFNFGTSGGNMEPEMLGALLALQNPSYWKDMMMPGFGWPESPPTMQDSTLFV